MSSVVPPLYDRKVLIARDHDELIKMQSVQLDTDPSVRKSPRVKDENHLFGTLKEGVYSIHDMFIHGYSINHDAPCAGWRPRGIGPFKWVTYGEVYHMTRCVGSGLIAKGAKANQKQLIGIFARNGVPWFVFDRTCAAFSMVSVPLYELLGSEDRVRIVNLCELAIIMADTNSNAAKLLTDAKQGKTTSLRLIVLVEEANDEVKILCEETSIEIVSYEHLQKIGEENLQEFVLPKPDDLYTISYTSGTTGTSRGAMLSHKNGVAVISACMANSADYFRNLSPDDIHLSFLPLAYVFERFFQCCLLMFGARIGFFSGDRTKLFDEAAALRPTVILVIPSVLNLIYAKINSAVGETGVKRILYNFCLSRKMAALKKGVVVTDSIWDKLIFRKFQAALGGRVNFALSATAPVSAEVLNVVRCVMGVPILEGYGLTESTSGFTTTLPGDFSGGNVGAILPNTIVKLIDVPVKGYYARDNKGEICCKGLSVFQGYYKDEAMTNEILDKDGWLHTGDIGEWLANGSLKIIDRRKNIFKLSQGLNITPERIEQIYQLCRIVKQVFVHGYSIKSCLVGIVVPDEDSILEWCSSRGIRAEGKSFQDICRMEEVSRGILQDMRRVGKVHALRSFELTAKIHVSSELFTADNGLLTPTLKYRRLCIEKRFKEIIYEMYAGLD